MPDKGPIPEKGGFPKESPSAMQKFPEFSCQNFPFRISLFDRLRGSIGQSGVEETDQNADERDDDQDPHDLQRAELLLGHEPPAQDNEDRREESGEHAVKLFLEDHVGVARLVVQSKARLYGYPCRGNSADDDSAEGRDGFTDRHTDVAYQVFNGLCTHVIALEVPEAHSEVREQVPDNDVENSTHG